MKMAMRNIFQALLPESTAFPDGYFIEGSQNDCSFLKHSKILEKNIDDYFPYQLAVVNYKRCNYIFVFCSVLFGTEICTTERLFEIDLTPGMIALFLSELAPNRLSSVSDDELLQNVFYPISEVKAYQGHDAFQIVGYFGSLKVFEIDAHLSEKISFCLLEFIFNAKKWNKAISKKSHIEVIKESLDYSSVYMVDLYSRILWTQDYENAFIKIYHLIEMLYPIPYVNELHSKIGINSHSVLDFFTMLLENLDWRYIEITALEKLLKEIPEEHFPLIENFDEISKAENIYTKNSRIIYDIRCRLVHKRLLQEKIVFCKEQWDHLYEKMLLIVSYLYKKYKNIIC